MLEQLKSVFKLDARSLALFRMGLGFILLVDLFNRARDLTAHYTDAGLLPRVALFDTVWKDWYFSLHLLSGEAFFQIILFILAALAAFALLVGYKTRLATIVSWVLLVSLHARNPIVLNSGDTLLRLHLFISMFLPLGAMWSVDKRLNPAEKDTISPKQFLSMATFALIVQVMIIYPISAFEKTGQSWIDGTAVYLTLNIDQHATSFGKLFLNLPMSVLKMMTHITFYIEKFAWIVLFIPFRNHLFRFVAFAAYAGMHFGFGLTLKLGIFTWVAIIGWLALLPPQFWDGFIAKLAPKQWLASMGEKLNGVIQGLVNRDYLYKRKQNNKLGVFGNVVIGFFITIIIMWNLSSINLFKFPSSLEPFMRYPRLAQGWAMFSPDPFKDDGWYVISGQLANQTEYDIYNDQPLSFELPDNISQTFDGQRWRRYMRNLWRKKYKEHRKYYSRYLCSSWNEEHKGTPKELETLQIFYMVERTQPNFEPPIIEKKNIWNHWCSPKFKDRFSKKENKTEEKNKDKSPTILTPKD